MLLPGNIRCFEHAIRNINSQSPFVEIGSFCGLSTCHINYFKRKYGQKNRLITCDKWIFERTDALNTLEGSHILHADFREFIIESYKRNVQFFCRDDIPSTVEMVSDEFFECWSTNTPCKDVFGKETPLGGPISFAYIDGNHTYPFAKRDLENVLAYLEIGGFVLLDDSLDFNGNGAEQVAKEALKNSQLELVSKNPNYFFRRIK